MTPAGKIIEQLGGNKFAAMTGATFTAANNGNTLFAKFKGSPCANCVKIDLEPGDTYTVSFCMIRGTKVNWTSTANNVFANQLKEIFERETGLKTTLSL